MADDEKHVQTGLAQITGRIIPSRTKTETGPVLILPSPKGGATPETMFPFSTPPPADSPLDALLRRLKPVPRPENGLFLVGGGVRDLLLNRPIKDVDLVCRGAAEFSARLATALGARWVPLGQDHDPPNYRIVLPDHRGENRAHLPDFLDVTEMHGLDIIQDLGRRDFTVNAMGMKLEPKIGTESDTEAVTNPESLLIDPHAGLTDLRKGLVRMTARQVIADDPLRILRGFRLRSQLGWRIDPETLREFSACASALTRTAAERISAELRLILESTGGGKLLSELDQAGVLAELFPEIRSMRGCSQNQYHHLDVLGHSLLAVEQCEALLTELRPLFGPQVDTVAAHLAGWRLPWLKLAVLLHDIGKPQTKGRNPNTGRVTFYGHDALSAEMMRTIALRLRLSAMERDYLISLIRHHMHIGALLRPQATKKARLRWMRRLGPDLVPATLLCMADIRATCGPGSTARSRREQETQSIRLIQEYLSEAQTTLTTAALLNGHDLLALGIPAGPAMGQMLKQLREAQDAGEIGTRDEALDMVKKIRAGSR